MSRALAAVVFITIIISLLSIWFYPSMRDFMASNATWNGIRRFSIEFNAEIPESADSMSIALNEPEKKALIAIPTLDYTEEDLLIIRNFVNDGGTLLLLDDYGNGNSILSYLDTGIRFSNVPLLDPLFSYKNQSIPRITDFTPDLKEKGIRVIMFNHATALLNVSESEVVAWSSKASFLDMDGNGVLSQGDIKGPLAVAAQFRFGNGIVVMVADSSIILNSMVGRDNNFDFIKYFTSQDGENKKIVIGSTHLAKAPLDIVKARLSLIKKAISNPYAMVGLMAFVFAAVYTYTISGGESAAR